MMIDFTKMVTKEQKAAKALQARTAEELAALDKTIYSMMSALITALLANNTLKGTEVDLLPLYQAVNEKKLKEVK